MSIIIFLVILAVLVLIHETGHFLTAKFFGIKVDEFGLGFPPRLWGKKIGETLYSVNAIPFGGFVKIFGEDLSEVEMIGTKGPDDGRSFGKRARPIQALVLLAGVAFNFLFALILLSTGFMVGLPTSINDENRAQAIDTKVVVTSVGNEGPAKNVGIMAGDTIVSLSDHSKVLERDQVTPENVKKYISERLNKEIVLTYERGGKTTVVRITPKKGVIGDTPAIGIGMDEVGKVRYGIIRSIEEGAKMTGILTLNTGIGLFSLINEAIHGRANLSEVSGPVGIAGLVGEASRSGFVYLLVFTAFISINLGVLNLIPFPALDGGRLLLVLIESIIRRPIKPIIANVLNIGGFALLMLLMAVVTYHDIVKLFTK